MLSRTLGRGLQRSHACKTPKHSFFYLLAVSWWLLAACAPPPALIGVDNPLVPAESIETATVHRVFIASTREPTDATGALYSGARAQHLGLVSVDVSVPPGHKTGTIKRPKSLPPDPRKEFAVVNPVAYAADQAFINAINAQLAQRPLKDRNILLFVHGYNNSTSDAVLRLAQFVHDTGYTGVPVLFDWASADKLTRYVYDLNSALIARANLEEVGEILGRTKTQSYDVFAHSMGTFLTMESLVAAAQKGTMENTGKLHTIVLASPDIDLDLFRIQMAHLDTKKMPIYVLLSQDDSALSVSKALAGGVPRVGASDAADLAHLGVIAIDLTEIHDSSSGSHSKFAGSPEVVQLLGHGVMRHDHFDKEGEPTNLGELIVGVPISVVFE